MMDNSDRVNEKESSKTVDMRMEAVNGYQFIDALAYMVVSYYVDASVDTLAWDGSQMSLLRKERNKNNIISFAESLK